MEDSKTDPAETTSSEAGPRTPEAVLRLLREHDVRFLSLQFVDVLGAVKAVDIPRGQFERALQFGTTVDGSGIEGFARVEESDLVLKPDPATFQLVPWSQPERRTARLLCDVWRANGSPFEGDPRGALRRTIRELDGLGLSMRTGVEVEFYLFDADPSRAGGPTAALDSGGFLSGTPGGREEAVLHEVVDMLDSVGFAVESCHHDRGAGQQGIDFRHTDPLSAADNLASLKRAVRVVARRHGLRASFMPKPISGQPGCGLHFHQSLIREERNVFLDTERTDGLSDAIRAYVGGLLRHARGMCAVTNPLVNSYKRLVPGFAAPVNAVWSFHNRSPMVRIPPERGDGTRCEVRLPDPAANPYLALTVQIAAGIAGLREEIDPPDPVNVNVWEMGARERQRLRIEALPRNLGEALDALEGDRVVRAALGEHIYSHFTSAKRAEFDTYLAHVHPWEVERYLEY